MQLESKCRKHGVLCNQKVAKVAKLGIGTPTTPLKVPRVKREHMAVVAGAKVVAAISKVAMVVGLLAKTMAVAVGVHEVAATARARTLVDGKVAVQAPTTMVTVMVGGGEQSNHDSSIPGMDTIGNYLHEPNSSHTNNYYINTSIVIVAVNVCRYDYACYLYKYYCYISITRLLLLLLSAFTQ